MSVYIYIYIYIYIYTYIYIYIHSIFRGAKKTIPVVDGGRGHESCHGPWSLSGFLRGGPFRPLAMWLCNKIMVWIWLEYGNIFNISHDISHDIWYSHDISHYIPMISPWYPQATRINPSDHLQAVPEMDRLVSCCGDFAARRRAAVARAKVHRMEWQMTWG